MLPKVEKIKKKSELNPDSEQPGLFDKENEKQRLIKKRRFVYTAMALTIGLSLSFWIYRSVKNFNFSLKFPEFNFSKSISFNKTTKIDLPQDGAFWSIFAKRLDTNTIIYQTSDNIYFDEQIFNQADFISDSIYSSSLPQGLKIKEITEENQNNFSYISQITTPNQQLILIIKIDNSPNLFESKKIIPNLIDQLYWYSLQK